MSILDKWLEKKGIKDPKDLDTTPVPGGSEREIYEGYKKSLSVPDLTLEDLKQFCLNQTIVIENKWKDLNLEQSKKAELIPYHTVYKTLQTIIESPQKIREEAEKTLTQLLQ